MGTFTYYAVDRLRGIQAVATLREGFRVQKSVPGLRRQVTRLLILNYLIFLIVSLLLNGLIYYYVLDPVLTWLSNIEGSFFASLGQWLLWLFQLTFAAVFSLIALRFSIEFSGIWHQQLVARVIRHYRQIPEVCFSFRDWLRTLVSTLIEALKLCLLPLLFLFASLIPGIGLLLVYIFESHLLGHDVLRVYLDQIIEGDERNELKKKLRWAPIKLGWLPMLLAFIPFAGWLLMPFVLILLVIGLTSQIERARN